MNTTKSLDFSLILPCYNEEPIFKKNVDYILQVLNQSIYKYEIIFVDDGSSDRTKKLIEKVCKSFPRNCRAIYHPKNKGRGATVADGFLATKASVIGYMDIDCEVSPVYIPEAISLILSRKADVVLGKRIYKTSLHSLFRELFSLGYKAFANFLLDTQDLDTECGYKFFNRKKILPILKNADHPHWFWDTQIIVLAKRRGLKIRELPVLFLRRFDKVSSVRVIPDILDYSISLFKFRRRLKKISKSHNL